jgi:predicted molibdopterin-dependent oxidoreductase YjgC
MKGTQPQPVDVESRDQEQDCAITYAGRTLHARTGQTVAAALTEAGVRSWRVTRREERPRGLFCGIGVCFDCLITIDGHRAQRACLVPVRDGMVLGDDDHA